MLPRFVNITSPGDGVVSPDKVFTPIDRLWDDAVPIDIWQYPLNHASAALPHRVFDDYDRSGADGTAKGNMPTVVQESAFLRATFYPHTGGKIASLVDKRSGRELLFDNPGL